MYVTAISPRFSLGRSTPATLAMVSPRARSSAGLAGAILLCLCPGGGIGGGHPGPLRSSLYPCRCLCRGFLQMIRTTPRRLTILQCSQRTLTDGRTFTDSPRLRLRLALPSSPRSYLNRYVIRPRVRSYGDSSTFTRSPARMRMKFMRILPLTCASTRCPLSSSTRNIAFGSGSTTVPSTSIASSFGIALRHLDGAPRSARQNLRVGVGHGDRVLEVGGQAAVPRHRR